MRCSRKGFQLTLAACGFGLLSGWAQADVILIGTPEGRPGDTVELSIAAEVGTLLGFIDIFTDYTSFDKVLTLIDFQPTPAIMDGSGPACDPGTCTGFFLPSRRFEEQTTLATWYFKVTQNAEDFVDVNGDRTFPFDLGVYDDVPQQGPLPAGQVFTVLAVPEPSSWSVMAVGILLLLGSQWKRWQHGSRGPDEVPRQRAVSACSMANRIAIVLHAAMRPMGACAFRVAQAQQWPRG